MGVWRGLRPLFRLACLEEMGQEGHVRPGHEPVCDLCHYDAHLLARLPVTEELKELTVLQEDDELSPYRNPYLKDLLEEERRRISGASDERRVDLRRSVEQMEFDLKDDERVYHRFEQYRDSLPHDQNHSADDKTQICMLNGRASWKRNSRDGKESLPGWRLNPLTGRWS